MKSALKLDTSWGPCVSNRCVDNPNGPNLNILTFRKLEPSSLLLHLCIFASACSQPSSDDWRLPGRIDHEVFSSSVKWSLHYIDDAKVILVSLCTTTNIPSSYNPTTHIYGENQRLCKTHPEHHLNNYSSPFTPSQLASIRLF